MIKTFLFVIYLFLCSFIPVVAVTRRDHCVVLLNSWDADVPTLINPLLVLQFVLYAVPQENHVWGFKGTSYRTCNLRASTLLKRRFKQNLISKPLEPYHQLNLFNLKNGLKSLN